MRVSTAYAYQHMIDTVASRQDNIARYTQQLASGKQALSNRDDASAASRALQLDSIIAEKKQYLANQQSATRTLQRDALHLRETAAALTEVKNVLNLANGAQTPAHRKEQAAVLSAQYTRIAHAVNAEAGSAGFIFGGETPAIKPYAHDPAYPQGTTSPPTRFRDPVPPATAGRTVAIERDRTLPVSEPLDPVLRAGPDRDVLRQLDQAALVLADEKASAADINATLGALHATVSQASTALSQIEVRNGIAQMTIADTQRLTRDTLSLAEAEVVSLTELDTTATVVRLQEEQTILQATYEAMARTSQLSLFNYLR